MVQPQNVHIIGNAHGTDPAKIASLVERIDLSKGDLYFDELKEERWRIPSSLPPFEKYVRTLTNTLSHLGSLIVPMGHDDLLYPKLQWPVVHACQPAEDVYMVEHVVIPVLNGNKSSKAVIHVGYTHMDRFVEELEKQRFGVEKHVLCEKAPEIDFTLALRDFAEGRRDTYLAPEFLYEFFNEVLGKMGERFMAPELASQLLASGDPDFVARFRKASPEVFADESLFARHTKVPEHPLDKHLRDAYKAAKENCDSMRGYANHPVIPAKSL